MGPHRTDPSFKVCGACGARWSRREDFLGDPALRLLGLQASARVPEASVLVFEHRCGGSVSVLTHRLRDLLPEQEGAGLPSLRGTAACAGHCLHMADHAACDRPCAHRTDRQLLALLLFRRDAPPSQRG